MKKSISLFIIALQISFLSAQNIKSETAECNSKFDRYAGISNVINGDIFAYNDVGSAYHIIGFNAQTMTKKVEFSAEIPRKASNFYVLYFTESKIMLSYTLKDNPGSYLADIYDFNGKSIEKGKALTSTKFTYKNGDPTNIYTLVSSNNKFILTYSEGEEKGRDYALFDSNLKLIWKKVVKFSGEDKNTKIINTILTNAGQVGVLYANDNTELKIGRVTGQSPTYTDIKSLDNVVVYTTPKIINTNDATYIGGVYQRDVENVLHHEKELTGAFSLKISASDLSVLNSSFIKFSEENETEFYKNHEEVTKHRLGMFLKVREPNHIYNAMVNSLTLDKEGNLCFDLYNIATDLEDYISPSATDNITIDGVNVNMTCFKIKNNQITDFNTIKKIQMAMETANVKYLGAVILCDNDHIYCIYNDDEDELKAESNHEIRINKSSLLTCANSVDNKVSKKMMLANDKHVLAILKTAVYDGTGTVYILATRDKSELVLIKTSLTQ